MTNEDGRESTGVSQHSEERDTTSATSVDINIAMKCVLKSNTARFVQCFEDEEDPYKETITDLMNERNDNGKTPLDMAAILERIEMLQELLARGVDVNKVTSTGYTALHYAASWGKIDSLKALVDGGADLQLRTKNHERARETALRYKKTECVDYLDWAEAKHALIEAIADTRETITDPEKVQGRLTRDDKNLAVNVCNEKSDWVESSPDATTQEFITQKAHLDEVLSAIWIKLSEPPPEKPEKK